MKNLTKNEIKTANKIAFSYLFSSMNILLNVKFKVDMRFRINKLAKSIVIAHSAKIDKSSIRQIRKIRSENKYKYSNILKNPLVVDYLTHKHDVKVVTPSHISFYNRNHWAKNEQDFRVLKVLQNTK